MGDVDSIPENVINSREEALGFINKYGIVTLFPIKGKTFPSLTAPRKGIGKGSLTRRGGGQTI